MAGGVAGKGGVGDSRSVVCWEVELSREDVVGREGEVVTCGEGVVGVVRDGLVTSGEGVAGAGRKGVVDRYGVVGREDDSISWCVFSLVIALLVLRLLVRVLLAIGVER